MSGNIFIAQNLKLQLNHIITKFYGGMNNNRTAKQKHILVKNRWESTIFSVCSTIFLYWLFMTDIIFDLNEKGTPFKYL